MKKLFLIPLLMLTFEASSLAGWFFQGDQQLKEQLQHERQQNGRLTGIIFVLGVGCVVNLVIGTMIGSKTRRASDEN